jgi:hypothetical protein
VTLDRDRELASALAQLRAEPPERNFEARLGERLAYEASLHPLRAEPPPNDFELRLHERIAAEKQGPTLRLVVADTVVSTSEHEIELTLGTPEQGAVEPLPSATPARRTRSRGAWLAAAIVLLAGGATASAQSGLFVGLAERVELVVRAWSTSRALAEHERAAPAPPERLIVEPAAIAPRAATLAPQEAPRTEPSAPPDAARPAPIERLGLSQRRTPPVAPRPSVERVRRDGTPASGERASPAHSRTPSTAAIAESRRSDDPRRERIERVRIEPGALRPVSMEANRMRPSDMVRQAARQRQERQERQRFEIVVVHEPATRRAPAPEPRRKERSPRDVSRGERIQR